MELYFYLREIENKYILCQVVKGGCFGYLLLISKTPQNFLA